MPVFLTIDTEYAWRHHAAGLDAATVHARSIEPGGVGIAYQLDLLRQHDLKACFFVDPLPAVRYGLAPFAALVQAILAAGQEVQLHVHPNWVDPTFELIDLDRARQRDIIAQARDLLIEAGAPAPVAFRAGSYGANDETLAALADLGFTYDSSHNGADHPWPSAIGLPAERIAPIERAGVIEVPVSTIEDRAGRLRTAQICALCATEFEALLRHAGDGGHAATVIVGHSFELANRAGTRANRVHVRRFEVLCAKLAARRETLPTMHFRDRPVMALDADDRALPASAWRRGRRQVAQAWSNYVEERA